MIYKFEQSHNTTETNKKIYCVKGKGVVDHSTLTA